MLCREIEGGLALVSQPAHAWLAAQLAMRWGNAHFDRPEPWAQVILAVATHDQGWLEWEGAPELIPETGRPRDFMHMAVEEHLAIWRRSIAWARLQSRYAALLVSRHATELTRAILDSEEDKRARSLRETFIAEQEAFQAELRRELEADPTQAEWVTPEREEGNLRLLQACDLLSLAFCNGWPFPRQVMAPHRDGAPPVSLRVQQVSPQRFTFSPYPFDVPAFTVHVEARVLPRATFPDERAFREALAQASPCLWTFTIARASSPTGSP